MKQIYFAGGCFWGTEHYMRQFDGVIETETGYANGHLADPTYQQVYTDQTGHAECVKVVYEPETISLATLCRLFFKSIDPLLKNRQGDDCGTRYRTGIYWNDPSDQVVVCQIYDEVSKVYGRPLAVETGPLEVFYPAEEYHQDYLVRNPEGYCHISLATMKFAREYSEITRELKSVSDQATKMVAIKHKDTSYDVIEALIASDSHECRLCALFILAEKYRSDKETAANFLEMNKDRI